MIGQAVSNSIKDQQSYQHPFLNIQINYSFVFKKFHLNGNHQVVQGDYYNGETLEILKEWMPPARNSPGMWSMSGRPFQISKLFHVGGGKEQ